MAWLPQAGAASRPSCVQAETGIEPKSVRQSEWRVLSFFKEEMGRMIARISRSRHTATEARERDHDRDRDEDATSRIGP
jgi:hypothetical protein